MNKFIALLLTVLVGCFPEIPINVKSDDSDRTSPCENGVLVGPEDPNADNDGDGVTGNEGDCDDCNASIFPGAAEVCDGVDNDCDGVIDPDTASGATTWYADGDEDGQGTDAYTLVACDQPSGYVATADDCDDTDGNIYVGADEYCDGADNNCDGSIDENAVDAQSWYADADADGFGDGFSSTTSCNQPVGYVSQHTDCDDTNAAINDGAVEICDGIDNDCDMFVDDDDTGFATGNVDLSTGTNWYVDSDSDGYGAMSSVPVLACAQPPGYAQNQTDCDDGDSLRNPGEAEVCDDGIVGDPTDDFDNDCDPSNDTSGSTYCVDADGDGYGDASSCINSCVVVTGSVIDATDCDDTNPSVSPGASELCSTGDDDDCDGTINEDTAIDATTWYADTDSDTYGDASSTDVQCTQPTGFVSDATDCDDTNTAVNPGADEYCSTTDDDDCDGTINESDAVDTSTWYADSDTDGYGDPAVSANACTAPTGYVSTAGDCDDADATSYGGAAEVCDGSDNNCDGTVDEGVTTTFYEDFDTDGFGDPSIFLEDCAAPAGYVTDNTDCDDTDATVNPDGSVEYDFVLDPTSADYLTEVDFCSDGADNDCDGDADSADWNCGDIDGDTFKNGADPYVAYDADSDGDEDLCAIAENLFPPAWASSNVYVQSIGALTTVSTSTSISQTIIVLDGLSVYAWCVSAVGTGYDYGFPISSIGASGSAAVNTSNCSDWVRPSEVCDMFDDMFCAGSGNSDGCDIIGDTGFGYYYDSTTGRMTGN